MLEPIDSQSPHRFERVLPLIAAVEAAIAVAPALTRRVVLLHRRPADISDCFQLKIFENIEIVVPAVPSQLVDAGAAFVVGSSVGGFQPLRFASVVFVVPCSYFAATSLAVVASLDSLIAAVETLEVASCFLFVVVA